MSKDHRSAWICVHNQQRGIYMTTSCSDTQFQLCIDLNSDISIPFKYTNTISIFISGFFIQHYTGRVDRWERDIRADPAAQAAVNGVGEGRRERPPIRASCAQRGSAIQLRLSPPAPPSNTKISHTSSPAELRDAGLTESPAQPPKLANARERQGEKKLGSG
ncbi:Hypothetical predicted protein [Podarcis lilfordi]|uniref:Uncharacterized protein n=1 Tax=Podarcis lilfordi TaxID=74358 RepID=A0AA35KKU1_9SAUR|nr:Hypothetical predicted protein [Podarcis lilfordi]